MDGRLSGDGHFGERFKIIHPCLQGSSNVQFLSGLFQGGADSTAW